MNTLDNFGVPFNGKRHTMVQPKSRFKFRVLLFGFNDQSTGEGILPLVLNTNSIDLPKVSYTSQQMKRYNTESGYLTRKSWSPITWDVRDDISNSVLKSVTGQAQKIHNYFRRCTRGNINSVDYKFEMWIQSMDGSAGDETLYGGTLSTWVLEGCTITNIDYGHMDYADNDLNSITLTLKPDNCYCVDSTGELITGV